MTDQTRVFYAADLHGSDICFRKWLKAGSFYGAEILIIGGDLTGKILVPIVPDLGGGSRQRHVARWQGRQVQLETRTEIEAFERNVRETGAYGFVTTQDELDELRGSPQREREIFTKLKLRALEDWVALADERLAASDVMAIVMPGNDDPPEVDELLATSKRMINVNGRAIELRPRMWMISRGESTPTPWNTPREIEDDSLGHLVHQLADEVPAGAFTIWNLHMPPYDTGIDLAPRLDSELRVKYDGSGEPEMVPVGSRSIRKLIEERQPSLALHGHIHEGKGRYKLGRTVGFNPGSQYDDGVLLGVVLSLSLDTGIRDYAFTAG